MIVLRLLLFLLKVVIGLTLMVVLCPPLVVYLLLSTLWFRFRHHGKQYLVYTRRHGWNEFVVNNLLPVVGHTTEAVLIPHGGRDPWPWLTARIHWATIGQKKPLIASVSWTGVHSSTLHETLLPLKSHGARDADVQQQLQAILTKRLPAT